MERMERIEKTFKDHTDADGKFLELKQTEEQDKEPTIALDNTKHVSSGNHEVQRTGVNERLMTPKIRRIMNQKDAKCMLKEEIDESLLRLKAAKFGHALEDIMPQYSNAFYLPDKSNYEPKINIEDESTRHNTRGYHQRSRTMGQSLAQSFMEKRVGVRKNSVLNNSGHYTMPFTASTKPMSTQLTHSCVDNSKVRNVHGGGESSTFITEPNQESLFGTGRPTQNLQQFFQRRKANHSPNFASATGTTRNKLFNSAINPPKANTNKAPRTAFTSKNDQSVGRSVQIQQMSQMTSARSSTEDRFTNYHEDQGSFSVRQKARDFIKNLLPRKPERLNDITYRFDKIKQRHMAMNSAVQDLTVKLPAPSLTKGAINLNEEAGAMF